MSSSAKAEMKAAKETVEQNLKDVMTVKTARIEAVVNEAAEKIKIILDAETSQLETCKKTLESADAEVNKSIKDTRETLNKFKNEIWMIRDEAAR
ncbi:MAG: hypothetical protein V1850_03980 [Candidatus Bathyarchaeota archaeon]